jgi:hypothetical protein
MNNKGKAIPVTGCGGPQGYEPSKPHIFQIIGSQRAVRLSALRTGLPLPPRGLLVFISVRGGVDPWAMVQLEGLGQ